MRSTVRPFMFFYSYIKNILYYRSRCALSSQRPFVKCSKSSVARRIKTRGHKRKKLVLFRPGNNDNKYCRVFNLHLERLLVAKGMKSISVYMGVAYWVGCLVTIRLLKMKKQVWCGSLGGQTVQNTSPSGTYQNEYWRSRVITKWTPGLFSWHTSRISVEYLCDLFCCIRDRPQSHIYFSSFVMHRCVSQYPSDLRENSYLFIQNRTNEAELLCFIYLYIYICIYRYLPSCSSPIFTYACLHGQRRYCYL